MKTRIGFVSNSSSTSFIIGLEKRPKTAKELQKMLFSKEEKRLNDPYDRSDSFPVKLVVETIFKQIRKPVTKKEMISVCQEGYIDAERQVEQFMLEHRDKVFFIAKFDGDTVLGSTLRSGREFELVPYLQINH